MTTSRAAADALLIKQQQPKLDSEDDSDEQQHDAADAHMEAPSAAVQTQAQPQHHLLHPLHLVLFALLHAAYSFALLLHSISSWTSPQEAHQQALAIGRAVGGGGGGGGDARGEQVGGSAGADTAAKPVKVPKHLALILQTPFTGFDSAPTPESDGQDEARAEAEWRAAEFLREEVCKVATWCDQLGVAQLTVMDTAGLLARAGLVPAQDGDGHDAQALPNGGHANGHAHLNGDEQSDEAHHLRKRARSRLRVGLSNRSALESGPSTYPIPTAHTRVSVTAKYDLSPPMLPIQVISPDEGAHLFAQTVDNLRRQFDAKFEQALQGGLDGQGASKLGLTGRRERRETEEEAEEGWTQIHARDSSGGSSSREESGELSQSSLASSDAAQLEAVRAEMMDWIETITVARVDEALLENGYISEPDFLILHGVPKRAVQLHGFPAWAVRLTEIFQDPQADPRRPIMLTTFVRAIKYFNRIEQRFGK
ncbi:hypothetical protein OC844_001363 [Tilletia horrida]|nr:hypothetical protein OC844_001363 [Tilletia horrida]